MPTTGISLVREHTLQMQLPRFLWVPFELGRPFGVPDAPDFQRSVLRSALELLERKDGPVVLADYPDDAPEFAQNDEHAAEWACPVSFHPPSGHEPKLVAATIEEMERLAPWHEVYVQTRGKEAPAASGLGRIEFVKLLGKLAHGNESPEVESRHAIHEWIRLGCEDLRAWYLEAAQGQPGRGSSEALRTWFWCETAAAQLIGWVAAALLTHPDPMLKLLAAGALVPRLYQPSLMFDARRNDVDET